MNAHLAAVELDDDVPAAAVPARAGELHLGRGRAVASAREAPDMLVFANLVWSARAVVQSDTAAESCYPAVRASHCEEETEWIETSSV